MNLLAIDDEQNALDILMRAIAKAAPESDLRGYTMATQALEQIAQSAFMPDVAFLDIEMPGMTGLELAMKLKALHPKINIIYVTGFSAYALQAHATHPSGYIMKPVTEQKIKQELDNLRNPLDDGAPTDGLRIKCFGNFEVLSKGEPVRFRYSKAKELFAYLIDRRGSSATTGELLAALWEDKPDSLSLRTQVRNLLSDLSRVLREHGAKDILVKNRNSFAVRVDQVRCDYYELLANVPSAINAYAGEYMSQYSWAEMTLAHLENMDSRQR